MKRILSVVLVVFLLASCKKESDDLQSSPVISDYAPLVVGKYVTYSLDSLVYTNLGTQEEHHLYEVKFLVADTFTDLLSRKAFRVTRFIRTLPTGSFASDATMVAVNTGTNFEYTDNNLRYLKLTLPFTEGRSWKGNSAIDVTSSGNDVSYLQDWDYTYADVNIGKTVGTFHLDSTLTVNQRDDSFNLPVVTSGPDATSIASRDYSQEIYSKNIGLVYKNFLHFEYQSAYHGYIGYGVTLVMTDHN